MLMLSLSAENSHFCRLNQSKVRQIGEVQDIQISLSIINKEYYLCLNSQISIDLINCGVNKDNIIISNTCTFENNNCHSFRRDGTSSGRMYSIIIKI